MKGWLNQPEVKPHQTNALHPMNELGLGRIRVIQARIRARRGKKQKTIRPKLTYRGFQEGWSYMYIEWSCKLKCNQPWPLITLMLQCKCSALVVMVDCTSTCNFTLPSTFLKTSVSLQGDVLGSRTEYEFWSSVGTLKDCVEIWADVSYSSRSVRETLPC